MFASASSPLVVAIVAAVFGALLTAVYAWVIARRQNSGDVDNSPPAELWTEGRALRKELSEKVVGLESKIVRLEHKIELQAKRITVLERERK